MDVKVMIGIPSAGRVHTQTLASLHALIANTRQAAEVQVVQRVGSPTDRVRNQIVREFLDRSDYTHLLFLDRDMAFPPDGLDRLLALDAPVAAGTYPMLATRISAVDGTERPNLTTIIGQYADPRDREQPPAPDGERVVYRWLDAHEVGDEPIACDGVGTGMCLIRREVFEAIEPPWFRVLIDDQDKVTTENLYFCRKVLRAGFTIVADPVVACDHFKRFDLSQLEALFTDQVAAWPWAEQPLESDPPPDARVMIGTVGRDEWLALKQSDFIFQQLSRPSSRVAKVSYNFGADWVRTCNRVFDEFLEQTECSHLLLLADDVSPPLDFLARALSAGVPFAGGCRRVVAANDIQYEVGFIEADGRVTLLTDIEGWRREKPSEVDFIGLGATLIARTAIDGLERPLLEPDAEPQRAVTAFCRRLAAERDIRPTLLPIPCPATAEIGLKPLLDLKGQLQHQSLATV